MSTDPHHDALLAIARSLTPDETAAIGARLAPPVSRMHGAEVADLLDQLDQTDAWLDKIEPFYEDHQHELPQVTGTRYALYALLALDAALTMENLTRMLTAAGLLPKAVPALAWSPVIRGAGVITGYQAESARWRYLTGPKGGPGYFLTRWTRGGLTYLDDLTEAVRLAAAVDSLDQGRRTAELFEAGEDIPELGWFHGPHTAQVTT